MRKSNIPIALHKKCSYSYLALCKITKLALTGYKDNIGAISPLRAFLLRKISMHSHIYVGLERDIFGCAGFLCHQSVNPFQLRTNQLTVMCEAPIKNIGAH
nr:hypothetical protein [Acinetobacter sp. MD2(2019)]